MTTFETPSVYYERTDASAPGIVSLRTDIAGFTGIARRGPLNLAVPVESWRQFQAHFGDVTGAGYLAYTIRAFFENGGRKCFVVRIASPMAQAAARIVRNVGKDTDIWNITASSPGVWGNALEVSIRETHLAQTLRRGPVANGADNTVVASVAGFGQGTLVRLTQNKKSQLKVVSEVDAENGLLYWVGRQPEFRLPYDSPLENVSANEPLLIESVEYTLMVRESRRLVRTYEALSIVPEHRRYGPLVLGAPRFDSARGTPQKLPAAPEPIIIIELRAVKALSVAGIEALDAADTPAPLTDGADGLAELSVRDFIGEEIDPLNSDLLRADKQRGLRVLETIDEVSILAVPDIQIQPVPPPIRSPFPPCVPDPCLPGPDSRPVPINPDLIGDLPPKFSEAQVFTVQAAMIDQCERLKDRFALLDPPLSTAANDSAGAAAIRAWRQRFDSKYAALHFPWVRVVDPANLSSSSGGNITRDIPPCGHVAGQFARTDLSEGVHKAPANAALDWVQDVTATVDGALHGLLNSERINAIRAMPGRGIRIFGARTVSSDRDWRFINVRRLMIMIEKAIYTSTQWAVFEPNDRLTRSKLTLSLTSFLIALWGRGALMGDEPAAAFTVRCDESNNPPTEQDRGRLLAEVSVAPSVPFEFIVLRVGRADNEFTVTEQESR